MNARGLYNQLIERSGAVHLTLDDGLFFVNYAQRWLDLMVPTERDPGVTFVKLASDEWSATLERSITVLSVTAMNIATRNKWELTRVDDHEQFLRSFDFTESGGTPHWFMVTGARHTGVPGEHSAAKTEPVEGMLTLMVAPKALVETELIVYGKAYSKRLEGADSESYWTQVYPELLVVASLWALEGFYRNTEGQKDWWNFMLPMIDAVQRADAERRWGHIKRVE